MKRPITDSKQFNLVRMFDEFARQKGISFSDGEADNTFVGQVAAAFSQHRQSPIVMHGFRAQTMFAYVAAALGGWQHLLRRKSGVDYALEYKKAILAEVEGNADAAKTRQELANVMTSGERSHSLCLVAHSCSDPLTQLAFYRLAAAGGNSVARRKLKEIERNLTPREIVEAISHYRELVSRFVD